MGGGGSGVVFFYFPWADEISYSAALNMKKVLNVRDRFSRV